jgi:hypothetical protein
MKMFWGKIEYHDSNEGIFTMYYARKCKDVEVFIKWLKIDTMVGENYLKYLKIVEHFDLNTELPNWFVNENKDRYNGYGCYQSVNHFS